MQTLMGRFNDGLESGSVGK